MTEIYEVPDSEHEAAARSSNNEIAKKKMEEIEARENAKAEQVRETKEAKPDPTSNNASGKVMKRVSKEEAAKIAEEKEKQLKVSQKGDINQEELPTIVFPTMMKIANKKYEKLSNFLAGVKIENGVSADLMTYRQARTICATGFGPLVDLDSGEEFTLQGEGKLFTCENKFWHRGLAIPERSKTTKEDALDALDAKVTPDIKEDQDGDSEPPQTVVEYNKHDCIKSAISRLRPGHKEDWTEGGLPDCRRLGDLLEDELPDDCGFDRRVSKAERDKAWGEWADRLDDEENKNAFTVPATDDIEDRLKQIKAEKGVKTLRQIAANMGIENTPRTGDAVIDLLIKEGVTEDNLREI